MRIVIMSCNGTFFGDLLSMQTIMIRKSKRANPLVRYNDWSRPAVLSVNPEHTILPRQLLVGSIGVDNIMIDCVFVIIYC